jgi:hypothetical protein
MAGERKYTRIPPESTGDRILMIHTAELRYDGKDTNHQWQIGEMYKLSGGTNSDNDFMFHVHGVEEETATAGVLAVHYNKSARHNNYTPEDNQLIQYEGATVATVNGAAQDLYIPGYNIMGYDNPEYGLDIDVLGAANVRFTEGQPQLDAWGKLRTAGATLLGDYVFSSQDVLDENFSTVATQGGASATFGSETSFVRYDNDKRSVDVGVTNPSDLATATAKTYHHYIAGSSHLFMGTCLFNEAGTVNAPTNNGASRRFGLFDAKNGFMFHVGPDGVLYLEQRNSNSGAKVDKLLACSDATTAATLGIDTFNTDTVDGSKGAGNPSGMLLNLANNNQYWIDMQWHGSGRVRFGTYHNGARVTMHEYYHNNRYTLPMNQTISLPCCTAVYGYTQAEIDANAYWSAIGGITAIDDNEIYVREFSQAVWTETDIDLQQLGNQKTFSTGHLDVVGSSFSYLFSLGIQPLADDGTNTNHSIVVPTRIVNINYDNNVGSPGVVRDAIVHWRASTNTVHHGRSWTNIPGTVMRQSVQKGINYEESDSDGTRIFEDMFNGRGEKDLSSTFIGVQKGTWKQASDDGGTFEEALTSITASSTGTVTAQSDAGSSTTLLVDDTSSIEIGASITGSNISAGTTVEVITNATTLELSNATTGSFGGTEQINFTIPVKVTTTADRWTLGEPYTKTFGANPGGGLYKARNFDGVTLSTNDVYLYITGRNTGVLYADASYTTPVTSTGNYSGSTADLYGFIGPDFIVDFFVHEQLLYQDPKAMFVIEWKEIKQ